MKFVSKFATALLLLALMLSLAPASMQTAQAATCYWAQFIADVTVPDGTNFAPNTAFKKTWRIKNIGSCAWNTNDVSLIFDSGERMGAPTSSALDDHGESRSNCGYYRGYDRAQFRRTLFRLLQIQEQFRRRVWHRLNRQQILLG